MWSDGDDVYGSLMVSLDLCERGEEMLERGDVGEAREVLNAAWSRLEPCLDSADDCGYGRRCDRYAARIQSALARCSMNSATGVSTAASAQAIDQLRESLHDDALNPDAHVVLAEALVSTMSEQFRNDPENWCSEAYAEAHFHACVAAALKRANKYANRGTGMGLGHDPPGVVPDRVKALFKKLGDASGWKRVIFCTGDGMSCTWLEPDDASLTLLGQKRGGDADSTAKEFVKKKATFVLLGRNSYTFALRLSGAQIDIYGCVDQRKGAKICTPTTGNTFLHAEAGCRVRVRNVHIEGTSSSQSRRPSERREVLIDVSGASEVMLRDTKMSVDPKCSASHVHVRDVKTKLSISNCNYYVQDTDRGRILTETGPPNQGVRVSDGAACSVDAGNVDLVYVGPVAPSFISIFEFMKFVAEEVPSELKTPLGQRDMISPDRLRHAAWHAAFFSALSVCAKGFPAEAWEPMFEVIGIPISFARNKVKVCSTNEQLTDALCPGDVAARMIIVLSKPGLAVEQPVNVKNSLLYSVCPTPEDSSRDHFNGLTFKRELGGSSFVGLMLRERVGKKESVSGAFRVDGVSGNVEFGSTHDVKGQFTAYGVDLRVVQKHCVDPLGSMFR